MPRPTPGGRPRSLGRFKLVKTNLGDPKDKVKVTGKGSRIGSGLNNSVIKFKSTFTRPRARSLEATLLVRYPSTVVVQPQVPLRLPCYDFTPVTNPPHGGGSTPVEQIMFPTYWGGPAR
ncbi:hypothetical protein PROFUN_16062 [Planoprotostelium fungivorum]|uniref:Uncharacterized protein n=1 Tax=Planoprotostelium fungivorum TaxID=1890364 RepID=A0A2P6MS99_9EUKA|nr:hypothetical protein PROFUN_16062 [Planoprotostelium fungivorum]